MTRRGQIINPDSLILTPYVSLSQFNKIPKLAFVFQTISRWPEGPTFKPRWVNILGWPGKSPEMATRMPVRLRTSPKKPRLSPEPEEESLSILAFIPQIMFLSTKTRLGSTFFILQNCTFLFRVSFPIILFCLKKWVIEIMSHHWYRHIWQMFGSSSMQSFSFLLLHISFVHIFSLFSGTLVTDRVREGQIFDDSIIYDYIACKELNANLVRDKASQK